jgi:hypothetical protein
MDPPLELSGRGRHAAAPVWVFLHANPWLCPLKRDVASGQGTVPRMSPGVLETLVRHAVAVRART